ncbi:hypothetical protein MG290_03825 [Flavobacterium sp. CBA20B-1]|uniref:hypothetical protein n=1 Tax=unclassified Flavobacterium TaxID=196869 RepID=UPI002224BAB6|nr:MULTISPECIES: hypothetical protein [unclassified Flavobacterium]WCM42822.1 hypothetical protein MG290_03825 [Flavobacterium sp. CBA20B-1]
MANAKNILLLLSFFTLLSCENKQSLFFKTFEKQFEAEIEKEGAKLFKFQYDPFSPQSSYFLNSKIKYLKIHLSGELSTSISLIKFENDSIVNIVEHFTTYGGNDGGRTAGRDLNKLEGDTIYVYDYKNSSFKSFVNKKLYKTSNKEFSSGIISHNKKWIYDLKRETEQKYNQE